MIRRNINSIKLGSITVAVLAFAGCRQEDKKSSDIKTLDQMASGSGASYTCTDVKPAENDYVAKTAMAHVILADGKNCLTKSPALSASEVAQCAAMKDVLLTIAQKNEPIVQSYFDDNALKGEIKISNDAVTALCQTIFSDEKSEQFIPEKDRTQIEGCWSIVPVDASKTVTLMVHKEDPDSIRRNGIRVFGMFYGQAVMQMVKTDSGKFQFDPNYSQNDSVRKPVWEKKKELAQTFLLDVKNGSKANSAYSLDKLPYIKDLPAATKQKILAATDVSQIPIDSLFGSDDKSKISAQRFVDTVVGQAFDSGFCQSTKNSKVAFVGTLEIFNNSILRDLTSLANSLGVDTAKVDRASAHSPNGGVPASTGQGFGLDMSSMFSMMMPMLMGGGMGMPGMGGMGMPGMGGMGMQNPQAMQLQQILQQEGAQLQQMQMQAQQNPAAAQQIQMQMAQLQQTMQQQQMQLQQMQMGSGMGMNPMMSTLPMFAQLFRGATQGCSGGNCANGMCSTGGCSGGNCPGGNCSRRMS